jgi:hypothetical protein
MFLLYFKQKKCASIQCDTFSSGSNVVSLLALTITDTTDTESYLSSDIESDWNIYTLCWFNDNYSKTNYNNDECRETLWNCCTYSTMFIYPNHYKCLSY